MYDVEYTAPFRGSICNSAVLGKMPAGTKMNIFLFHGSPDMLLNSKPIEIHKIATTGCVETKKVNRNVLFASNSTISEEVGQLVPYVHQMMMVFAVNQLMKGTECTCIKGIGLYVMKCGKCILLNLSLSADSLSVNAHTYFPILVKPAALCKALQTFTVGLGSCN